MLTDIDDMLIDQNGLTPLLVDKNSTKIGLDILKKYKLSVFKNITPAMFNIKLYDDNWAGPNLTAHMNTAGGKLYVDLFLPNEHFSPNTLTIFIDGVSIGTKVMSEAGTHHLEFKTLSNKNVSIRAVFGKSFNPKRLGIGEDQRELSAIVTRFEFGSMTDDNHN